MLVFSNPLVNGCPSTFFLTSPIPPPPSQSKRTVQYISTVFGCGEWGVLSCVVDYILQEFSTLFPTRFRTFKIATSPQTKTPVRWHLGIGVFIVPSSMGHSFALLLQTVNNRRIYIQCLYTERLFCFGINNSNLRVSKLWVTLKYQINMRSLLYRNGTHEKTES